MPLELGTYISDLVVTNPVAADNLVDGDDHLRLIKATLKTTFPTINAPLTATPTELNYVSGVTSAVQTQLNTHSTNITTAQTTASAALPKAGGTMSGPIAMGTSKITGMADGVVATDAATVGQATVALTAKANLTPNTFTGNQTISTGTGGIINLNNTTTPGVVNTIAGYVDWNANNGSGVQKQTGVVLTYYTTVTAGAEASSFVFSNLVAGSITPTAYIGSGLFMNGTSGDKGLGTGNFTTAYSNGVAVSPIPTSLGTIGQVTSSVVPINTALVAPAGGMWMYILFANIPASGASSFQSAGVVAGGATIAASNPSYGWAASLWRVS